MALLYRALLEREPDDIGYPAYMAALRDGRLSIADVFADIAGSAEYRARKFPPDVFHDELVRIPYLGCEFMIAKSSPVVGELTSPEGYEPWVLPHFMETCREGMRVLDIGASWGVYAFPAAKRVGPQGRVFGVEVSRQNCRVLLHNARLNALDNFEIIAVGASDRVGTARLPIQTQSNTNSIHPMRPDADPFAGRFDVVPTLPLDLLRAHLGRIDLMKMDIDGAEYRACIGARELLSQSRPIVFLEYCPQLLRPLSGIEPGTLLKLFLDLGYGIEVMHRARPKERIVGASHGEIIAQVDRICAEHVKRDRGTHLDLGLHPNAGPAA